MNFQGLTKITKTIGGFASKNSTVILTGASVAGVLATTIFGVQDTLKAVKIIEHEENKIGKHIKMPPKQIVKATWKCYVRTLLMGGVTIGCIIGGNSIHSRRNAALAGLYSLSETALKEYKDKVVEKLGEDKAKEIKDEVKQDIINRNPVSNHEIIRTGHGDTLCYDEYSGRYFWSDMNDIKAAVNNINRTLRLDNEVSLNDFYSEVGLERVKMGDLLTWYVDYGQVEVEFSSTLADDGRPCLVIDFDVEPKYCNREF